LRKIRKRSRVAMDDTPEISIVDGEIITKQPLPQPPEDTSEKIFVDAASSKRDDEIPVFSKDETDAIFDTLTTVQSVAASKMYGIPSEITRKAMEYDEFHRRKLAPRMERLLNKWAPLVIKKWKDEIGFGIVFLAVVNSQVKTMHAMEDKRRKSLPKRGVTEIGKPAETPKQEPKTEPEVKPAAEVDELDSVGFHA
jgi:hypothetical protein